jgi:hypothetical protein
MRPAGTARVADLKRHRAAEAGAGPPRRVDEPAGKRGWAGLAAGRIQWGPTALTAEDELSGASFVVDVSTASIRRRARGAKPAPASHQ